jgi:hypothetical protein
MSTANYEKIYRNALKLTAKYGRSLTLVQLDATPSNVAQPWKGNTDVRGEPIATLTVNGVFVEPESLERLGKQRQSNDFVKSAEQTVIVIHDGSLGVFDELIDVVDSSRWTVHNIQELQPGDKIMLHYLRVQRRGRVTSVRGALL